MSASTKLVLIVLTLVAISLATVLITVPAIYHPTYLVRAERLNQQPDTYFVLENPDAAVVQAIANRQESVTINSLKDTQLDDLTNEHNTSNVQVMTVTTKLGLQSETSFPTFCNHAVFDKQWYIAPFLGRNYHTDSGQIGQTKF